MLAYCERVRIVPRPNAIYKVYRDLDISRDELARRMGVSTATAYRIEQGKVDPSPLFMAALIKVSGRPFDSLFEIVAREAAVS